MGSISNLYPSFRRKPESNLRGETPHRPNRLPSSAITGHCRRIRPKLPQISTKSRQTLVDRAHRRLYTDHRFGFQSSIRNVPHQRLP